MHLMATKNLKKLLTKKVNVKSKTKTIKYKSTMKKASTNKMRNKK